MDQILNRRSTRVYDENVKISREEMNQILTEAMLAPSSRNQQPWRFVVVYTKLGKEKLGLAMPYNLNQLNTSAAMIVVFQDLQKYKLAEVMLDQQLQAGMITQADKEKNLKMINDLIPTLKPESLEREGLIDCGLVAMQLMIVARFHGYDTCPIGGFERDKINDALDYDKSRFKPVMIVSIGKAKDAGKKTLRLPLEHTITYR
jgi:nitroreductase